MLAAAMLLALTTVIVVTTAQSLASTLAARARGLSEWSVLTLCRQPA